MAERALEYQNMDEQDQIIDPLAPASVATEERDAMKQAYNLASEAADAVGQSLDFAAYVVAWLDCLESHGLIVSRRYLHQVAGTHLAGRRQPPLAWSKRTGLSRSSGSGSERME